jgi:hypothetical protein
VPLEALFSVLTYKKEKKRREGGKWVRKRQTMLEYYQVKEECDLCKYGMNCTCKMKLRLE